MNTRPLEGCRILVVEDESIIACNLSLLLQDAGAVVLDPAPSVRRAIEVLRGDREVHGAVLDVNLGGEMVFPVADALALRGIPFVFATGYDGRVVPARFSHIARCEKPVEIPLLVHALSEAVFAHLAPGHRRLREMQGKAGVAI
jgi:CheY-like chemotaxis protein